jgi:hypothetical protein
MPRYGLSYLRELIIQSACLGYTPINYCDEVERLIDQQYDFHYLRGFIEGAIESILEAVIKYD